MASRGPGQGRRLPGVGPPEARPRAGVGEGGALHDGNPGGGEHQTRHVYSGSVVGAILSLVGNPASFGRAYNLAQDETPPLLELLAALAAALGAAPRFVDVSQEAVRAAGIDPLVLSPFSGHWMSFIDPSLAKAELGYRHEPLASYLAKIVACFLAHPPGEPPPGYERRATERQLAGA